LTQAQIVTDGLKLDSVLENTYNFTKDLLNAAKYKGLMTAWKGSQAD